MGSQPALYHWAHGLSLQSSHPAHCTEFLWSRQTDQQVGSFLPLLHCTTAVSPLIPFKLNEDWVEWSFALLFLPSLSRPLLVPLMISHHQRSSWGQAKQPWLLGSTPTTNQQWQHPSRTTQTSAGRKAWPGYDWAWQVIEEVNHVHSVLLPSACVRCRGFRWWGQAWWCPSEDH